MELRIAFTMVVIWLITFRIGETYVGHGHLFVCLSVPQHMPTLLHGPACNLGEW